MPCENFFMLENAFGDLQCLLCYKSFKGGYRCNIKRHFDSSHKNIQILDKKASQGLYEEKKLDFLEKFKGWLAKVENEQVVKQLNIKMKAELSSMILYIAKQGRPFIDGVFVKNICLKIFQKMNLDTELVKNISISRQTVARRIDELGIHIQSAVKEKINDCQFFSLCLDETTDINDLCQLAICVRTVNVNYEITETMFSLETFCGNVTGKILFDVVHEKVFSVFDANKFVGVCADGANVMAGKIEGQLNKNGISGRHFHCIIHQVALASKFLSGYPVMKRAELIINGIRGGHHFLTHRKFVNFLKTTSARHNDLKMYTDIRWLSRGDCLNRLFELREEVLQFLEINCNEDTLVRSLKDDNFILDLAFLADVSFFLNKLNLKLKGKETGINDAVKNVHQFQTDQFFAFKGTSIWRLCPFSENFAYYYET